MTHQASLLRHRTSYVQSLRSVKRHTVLSSECALFSSEMWRRLVSVSWLVEVQEVMRDPHIAADEMSYEGSEIRKWIDAGKRTSPMTNEGLTHDVLIRSTALRRAIEDWQKQQLQLQQASRSGAGDDDRSHWERCISNIGYLISWSGLRTKNNKIYH